MFYTITKGSNFAYTFSKEDVNEKNLFPFMIKDIHEAILKKPQIKMSASPIASSRSRKNSLQENELHLQK